MAEQEQFKLPEKRPAPAVPDPKYRETDSWKNA